MRALSAVVTERDFLMRTTTLGTFRNNIKAYPQLESFDNRAQNEKKFPATRKSKRQKPWEGSGGPTPIRLAQQVKSEVYIQTCLTDGRKLEIILPQCFGGHQINFPTTEMSFFQVFWSIVYKINLRLLCSSFLIKTNLYYFK